MHFASRAGRFHLRRFLRHERDKTSLSPLSISIVRDGNLTFLGLPRVFEPAFAEWKSIWPIAQAMESLLRRFITTKNLFYAKRTYLLQYTIRYFTNSSRIILFNHLQDTVVYLFITHIWEIFFAKLFS